PASSTRTRRRRHVLLLRARLAPDDVVPRRFPGAVEGSEVGARELGDVGEEALALARAELVGVEPREERGDAVFLGAAEHALGHAEEDLVLLVDVRAEEVRVGVRGSGEAGARLGVARGRGIGDGAEQLTALLVLVEHHPDRAAAA